MVLAHALLLVTQLRDALAGVQHRRMIATAEGIADFRKITMPMLKTTQ